MTTNETETPLMRKIRLLMAKAEGTNNEHEAATFAAKVQELLLQNGLSVSDIQASAPGQRTEQVGEHDAANGGRDFLKSPHRKALLQAVCRFYMCSYLRWGNNRMVFVGKAASAEVAASMMDYLLRTVVRLSNAYAREHAMSNAARVGYRRGCMLRLTERLQQMTMQREREARQPSGGGSNLPALFVSESALVKEYLAGQKLRKSRPLRLSSGEAHGMAGRRGADGISLSPQVGQGSGQRAIGRKA